MKRHFKYTILFFIAFIYCSQAQFNKAKFQRDFFAASPRGKVQLVASVPYSELKDVYPFIRDTLEKIKADLYKENPSKDKDLRFLFDKMEAGKELYLHNYGKAIFVLENALHYTTSNINDSLLCLAMLKRAFVKIKNANRAFEVQYLMENRWHRKSDTVKIDYGIDKSYLYHMLGLNTEAIAERRREFNNRENKKDTDLIVNFYNDMGVYYNQQKNSDSAEFYFLKARHLLDQKKISKDREIFYDFYKGLVDGNLGLSYFNRGHVKEAIPLLKRDVYYSLRSNNYESAFNSYNLMVQCYIDLKEKHLAGLYLDSARKLMNTRLPTATHKIKLLPTAARYYSVVSDYKKAAESYSEYFHMNDSIQTLEKERDLVNQGLTFNIEQRELAYAEKTSRLQREEVEEEQNKVYSILLIGSLLVLSVIIIFLIANNQRVKRREVQLSIKNKQIQEQNKQIEHSLKEKEALIKEIHHRVKNNLQIITSMLNLQIGKIEDEKTESIFFEAKQRINAIALTHQMLYQKTTISNINLVEYIDSLVKQIEASMSTAKVSIVTELAPTQQRLTIDGAVPLGLIINELLTNCYKHAFPQGKKGLITVSLIEHADTFTIKVSDNGIGLPEDFDQGESKTLGMELVYILVEQLDSKLIIENNNGSSFSFDIKKTH